MGREWICRVAAGRVVMVKGLADRDMEADLALWPFQIAAAADDLTAAQAEIERSMAEVGEFLAAHGVDTSGTELQGVEVTEKQEIMCV